MLKETRKDLQRMFGIEDSEDLQLSQQVTDRIERYETWRSRLGKRSGIMWDILVAMMCDLKSGTVNKPIAERKRE